MPPPLGWSDLAGAGRIGVWGLGVEGRANLARLRLEGIEPVLVDDRPDTAAGVIATAAGGLDRLAECAVVVKTPGISRYRDDARALVDRGVVLAGGLGLWLADAPLDRVICVTGTKGKSTTVSVAGHLAAGLGVRCFVGGNIGRPPYDPDAPDDADLWIIEVSSYQATDVAVSPPVVAVTSLHPDHLDWHGSEGAYYHDKLSLTSRPGARITVASAEDERLHELRSLLGPEVHWVGSGEATGWSEPLGLLGRHNAVNAAIARAVLVTAGVTAAEDDGAVRAAAAGYPGLDSRLRVIATVDGVEFVDDSLSTNVLPTMAAVDAFPERRVAVLLGGFDRGIDYGPLATHLASRAAPTLALTLPDSGDRIADALEAAGAGAPVEVVRCADLPGAVARAFAWARPDGVVLLSPAAPSFGRFRDYRDRAAAFADAAAACGTGRG